MEVCVELERQVGIGNPFAEPPFGPYVSLVPSLYEGAAWQEARERPFPIISLILYRRPGRVYLAQWGVDSPAGALAFPAIELGQGETSTQACARLCTDYLGFEPSFDPGRYTEVCTTSIVRQRRPGQGEPAHFLLLVVAYRLRTAEAPHPNRRADRSDSAHHPFLRGDWVDTYDMTDDPHSYGMLDAAVPAAFLGCFDNS